MSKDVELPTNYTLNTIVSGSLDMDLDNIRIKEIPAITLNTDSTVHMGLDNIRVTQLPRIDVQMSIKPTRVHFPVNLKFGLCTMGVELLAFCVCGESMMIIEDYHQHASEECA